MIGNFIYYLNLFNPHIFKDEKTDSEKLNKICHQILHFGKVGFN